MAAGLMGMGARSSRQLGDRDAVVAEADDLRDRGLRLADRDRDAYAVVLARSADRDARPGAFRDAVAGATRPPLDVTAVGLRTVELGLLLLGQGAVALRGDVFVGVTLGAAAVTGATELVALNTRLADLATTDLTVARDRERRVQEMLADLGVTSG